MMEKAEPVDPQSVFCEVCAKPVAMSRAVMSEGRDHTAYFCSDELPIEITLAGRATRRWRGVEVPLSRVCPPTQAAVLTEVNPAA